MLSKYFDRGTGLWVVVVVVLVVELLDRIDW
jgi:hypothetical protein